MAIPFLSLPRPRVYETIINSSFLSESCTPLANPINLPLNASRISPLYTASFTTTLVSTVMISCLNCCYCLLFDHLESTLAHIHSILQTEIRVSLWKYKLNHSIPYSYFLMCFHLTQSLHLQGPVYWLPDISLTSLSTTHSVIPSSRVMLTSMLVLGSTMITALQAFSLPCPPSGTPFPQISTWFSPSFP